MDRRERLSDLRTAAATARWFLLSGLVNIGSWRFPPESRRLAELWLDERKPLCCRREARRGIAEIERTLAAAAAHRPSPPPG